MLRLLIRFFIFIIIIGLSLYFGAQWKLEKELDTINSRLGTQISFDYEDSHLSLMGEIILSRVTLNFIAHNISISVDTIKYSSGSVLDMVFLAEYFKKKELPRNINFNLSKVNVPLTPALVKLISENEAESIWGSMQASACGDKQQIGIKEYFAMGYDSVLFSMQAETLEDDYSDNMSVEGWFEIEDASRIDYKINLADFSFNEANGLGSPSIDLFHFELQDLGYNHYRNNYCSGRTHLSTEQYIEQHIKTVEQRLDSVGIKLTLAGAKVYKELLQPDSQLLFTIEPNASFSFNGFNYYNEEELRDLLALDLKVNNRTVSQVFKGWALDKFENIAIRNALNTNAENKEQRFETVIIKRSYRHEAINTANEYIDFRIKVVRDDGKVTVGKLRKINKGKFYIDTSMGGGTIQTAMKTSRIKQLFIYR